MGFIDFITPILAFIFIKQIIVVFSGSFIKLPFVLKCLCFTALITAQFITLAFCQKIFSTDFALTETKAPVIQSIQVISDKRIKRAVGSYTFCSAPIIRGMEILKNGDGGRIVPPEDTDSLASAMQEMLNDAELARQTEYAIKSAQVYTIENMAKQIAEVIRNIC